MSDRGQVHTQHWSFDAIAVRFPIVLRGPNETLDQFVDRLLTGLRERGVLHGLEDVLHDILLAIEQSSNRPRHDRGLCRYGE
ncbi:MAG: hypothetical protein AB7G08_33570 [Hyphomicrobiaceae bacterium]